MKLISDVILSILIMFVCSFAWGMYASENNVPGILIGVVGLGIGFFLPGFILRWIYKEEIAKLKSEESEDK